MKRLFFTILIAFALLSCGQKAFDPSTVSDQNGQITRVEPMSWWVGMKTPLQLLIAGENISTYDVTIAGDESVAGGKGVSIKALHKADSPNYIFADFEIATTAKAGTYWLVFTKDGESFKYPYELAARQEGSAERGSFGTSDMIYLIMPDRFANGDPSNDSNPEAAEPVDRSAYFGRHGGDLQGIINHLDYISGLGATAIWCTPLLWDNEPKASYHGYACADYYKIDPRIGTNDLFKEYVNKAHEHGIKIIMDCVPNHCGAAHWWMKDLPFNDWVHQFPEYTHTNVVFSTNMDPNASKKDLYLQESGWFDTSMVDMNLDNPYTLQYFKQMTIWWMEWSGMDGYRIDTYPYAEKIPASELCAALRTEYPAINIVGECWTNSYSQLAYWQADNENKDGFNSHLPSIMDFPLYSAMTEGVATAEPGWDGGLTKIYTCLSHDFVYHDLSHMMIFAANHDTARLGDVMKKDTNKMKMLTVLLSTLRGYPQTFAGDEFMQVSDDVTKGDGALRADSPGGWEGDAVNLFDPAQRDATSAELIDFNSKMFNWRKTKDVIHNGKTMHFISRDNTYAYFRYNDTDAVFVYLNNSQEPKNIPWTYYSEISSDLKEGTNVVTGESVTLSDSTVVAPQSTLVVEFKK